MIDLNPSTQLDDFLTFLRDCEQHYRMAIQSEQEANDETQDILHMLEFEKKDYHALAQISKELKSVRQNRRNAKDTISILLPVVEWVEANKKVIGDLGRLLGAIRKAERNTENRIYTPKSNIGGLK